MHATAEGHQAVSALLIAEKADVNAKNWAGCTIIMYAAGKGFGAIIGRLIEAKADVNAQDNYAQHNYLLLSTHTALQEARAKGRVSVVEQLLQAGAIR
jgi:ankyrin repeat protein